MKLLLLGAYLLFFNTYELNAQQTKPLLIDSIMKVSKGYNKQLHDARNSKPTSRQTIENKDSLIGKTKNGFDIKSSSVDNMVYLNANNDNATLKKMPMDSSVSYEKMPIRKIPLRNNRFGKDTSFNININSDSIRKWNTH